MLATFVFLAAAATEPEITVRGSAARPAIERILKADNVEVERLAPAEVATAMEAIGRGAAPGDFWNAYQAHVRAWRRYADLQAASRRADPSALDAAAGLSAARIAINATFDEVERLAQRHGVAVPIPRSRF